LWDAPILMLMKFPDQQQEEITANCRSKRSETPNKNRAIMRYEQQWQSLTISLTIWLHEFPTVCTDQCKTSTNILGLCQKSESNRKTQPQMWKKQNWKEKPRKRREHNSEKGQKKKTKETINCFSFWIALCLINKLQTSRTSWAQICKQRDFKQNHSLSSNLNF
jgi:hypothetical protein